MPVGSTTIDRMGRRAVRQARWKTAALLAILALIAGAGLHAGRGDMSWASWASWASWVRLAGPGLGDGSGGAAEAAGGTHRLLGASQLGADDPALNFARTRIGQVLYAPAGSDLCRRALFDNQSGAVAETPSIFCGQTAEQLTEPESPERLNALRRSFQR